MLLESQKSNSFEVTVAVKRKSNLVFQATGSLSAMTYEQLLTSTCVPILLCSDSHRGISLPVGFPTDSYKLLHPFLL